MTRTCVRSLALMVALATCLSSCGRKTDESSTTEMVPGDTSLGSNPTPPVNTGSQPPSVDTSNGTTFSDSLPNVAVTGSLAQLRERLRNEALKLDHAVATGDMKEIIVRTTLVRDVVVAIGGKAVEFPKVNAIALEQDLADVVDKTDKMRADAKAGKRLDVKADNAQLQPLVARVLKLSAPA